MAAPEWNFGHVAGVCDVAYIGSGDDARLVTCGADNAVYVRHPSSGEVEESFTEEHEDMVNVVAVAPDGKTFATGSDDACVKLFAFEDGKRAFESNVTRFSLPVRALAFSADGAFLAAGGEDACVKVIKMADRSVALTLQTRSKCVKSVSFDPKGQFLSATDDVGQLTVWSLAAKAEEADAEENAADGSGPAAAVEPGDCVMSATVAPVTAPDAPSTNGARWRPDGEVLAAPGRENDVTFFERRGWTELDDRRLGVELGVKKTNPDDSDGASPTAHTAAVAFVAWSPNGKYLLSSGADCLVAVWDVAARTVVSRTRHDAIVCAAAWRAEKNAVAMVDANGQWAEWTDVVPESMPSPFAPVGAEALDMSGGAPRDGREAVSEDDDADRADADADDDLADMDEEAYYAEMDRRRAEKRRKADEKRREAATAAVLASNTAPGVVPTPQAPFQVGAVKAKTDAKAATATTSSAKEKTPASRRFLCYNMLGSVTSAGESGSDFNVIEMAFHDTSRRGRVPTITDYHGYDVAVLGERGCALASPGSKDGGAATVFYRPYESWAHAPEWRVALPKGERAVSVAAGSDFVAALTSERLLRVFTPNGAQKHIVQLEGAPVTCAAKGDSLVVCWHAAAPIASSGAGTEQRLAFAEYDMGENLGAEVLSRGALPLSPGSTLTWLGHVEQHGSEDISGAIAYAASDGVVRVRTPAFGGSFAPVFRSSDARAQEGEHHWPVAVSVADDVNGGAGFYAVCCRDANGPPVFPKPVLTPLPLSHPVALPEGSAGELEDAASRARVAAALAAATAERERARRGAVSGASADALREAHAASDKASLRLFHAACKAERPARAADVAAMLHLGSSMHGALKLANALGQNALAGRVTSLIEATMAAAAAEAAAAREPAYYEHPSQLETPGQDRGELLEAPAARKPADDDANPFARRKPSRAEKPETRRAETDAENDTENVSGSPRVLKSKAGFERDVSAAPPAKKVRASNPFARK